MIYADFVQPGDLCFDIGANKGVKSGELLAKGARVIAIEPQRELFHKLLAKFGSNSNIIIQNYALGSGEKSELVLKKCSADTIASISDQFITETKKERFKTYNWNKTEVVYATTLDVLVMKYGVPKFCKIDVEGYEFEVLKGLHQKIPFISIEYTPELFQNTLDCLKHLQSLAPIQCNYGHCEHDKLYFAEWQSLEQITPFIKDNPLYKEDHTIFGDIYIKM